MGRLTRRCSGLASLAAELHIVRPSWASPQLSQRRDDHRGRCTPGAVRARKSVSPSPTAPHSSDPRLLCVNAASAARHWVSWDSRPIATSASSRRSGRIARQSEQLQSLTRQRSCHPRGAQQFNRSPSLGHLFRQHTTRCSPLISGSLLSFKPTALATTSYPTSTRRRAVTISQPQRAARACTLISFATLFRGEHLGASPSGRAAIALSMATSRIPSGHSGATRARPNPSLQRTRFARR